MNIKNLWLIAILAVLGAVALWGCSKTENKPTDTTPPSDSTSSTTQEKPAPDANVGGATAHAGDTTAEPIAFTNDKGQIVCPVMGTVIESKDKAVGYQDYEGVRYYFCCDGCPEQFKKDPEKYAKKSSAHSSGEKAPEHTGTGSTGA